MPEGLKIIVSSDVQQAVKALASDIPKAVVKTETALTHLQKQVAAFGGGVNSVIRKVALDFSKLPSFLNPAEDALKKFSKTSSQATAATINLGRVIQDAPFGFLGIANNLNPLLESFQRLKASTGSTGGALKELGKSLTGAGGLGLALSVASSLLIVFGDRLFSSTAGINTAEVATNRFKDAIKNLGKEIDDIKNRLDFSAEVQKLQFTLANGSGANANIFGLNLDSKNATKLISEIDKRIDQLGTTVLKFTPQVEQFNNAVANIPTRFLSKGQALVKLYGDINKIPEDALAKVGEAEKNFIIKFQAASKELVELEKVKTEAVQAVRINGLKVQQEQLNEQKRLNDLSKADYQKYVSDTIAEAKRINDAFKGGIDLQLKEGFFDTVTQKFQKALDFLKDFRGFNFKFTITPTEIDITPPTSSAVLPHFSEGINIFQKEIDEYFKSVPVDFSLILAVQNANAPLSAAEKLGADTAAAFNEGMKNALAAGVGAIGEGIGTALTGGGIGDAFKQFAASIGDALQAMGKQIIGIGIAALLAKQALKTLFANPATAIIAGTALVAAGAALKSVLSGGIKGFAAGGLVTGPQLALIGEGSGTSRSNPEVVAPLDKLKGMLQGIGGGGGVYIINKRVRGRDQVLQLARETSSQRRTTGR